MTVVARAACVHSHCRHKRPFESAASRAAHRLVSRRSRSTPPRYEGVGTGRLGAPGLYWSGGRACSEVRICEFRHREGP